MNGSQLAALLAACVVFVLIGMWVGWECWGRPLKREKAKALERIKQKRLDGAAEDHICSLC